MSYLQPHDQRQVLVSGRLAVSIIQPPEHVGPVSHFHIVPGFFALQGTGETCGGFIDMVSLGYTVTLLLT